MPAFHNPDNALPVHLRRLRVHFVGQERFGKGEIKERQDLQVCLNRPYLRGNAG